MNIDTIFVLSDPLKVGRLLYVLRPFLEKDIEHKSRTLNRILQDAKDDNPTTLGKYLRYEQTILENLPQLKGKNVIFINGISPDLMESGRPGRSGVDPFSHIYGLSEDLIQVIQSLPPEVQKYVKDNLVFWPVAPIDFPFFIDGDRIVHCFAEQVAELSRSLEEEGKSGFGSLEKKHNDTGAKVGNAEFKERLFDSQKLKKSLEDNPSMYLKEREGFDSTQKFFRHATNFTSLNRWLLSQKYRRIAELLGLKKLTTFFVKSCFAQDALARVSKETGIPLDVILKSKRGITLLRERDPTYLNQLAGRIQAMAFAEANIPLTPIRKVNIVPKKAEPLVEQRLVSCPQYPFFRCEHGTDCSQLKRPRRCTAEFIREYLPKENIDQLAVDARMYNYGLVSGEYDLYLQNLREYEEIVLGGKGRTSTIKERDVRKGNRLLVPLPYTEKEATDGYELRASEFGTPCPISRIFSKMDKESYPIKTNTRFAQIGIALHWIKNQQPLDWESFIHNSFLETMGVKPMPRWEYREKAVVYDCDGIRISGHPDCVTAYQEKGVDPLKWDLCIQDIKRGMLSANEKTGYIDQTLVYALAIVQIEKREPENLYLTLIKTPFDPRRFTQSQDAPAPLPQMRDEAYRLHRYSKLMTPFNSEAVNGLRERIKGTYEEQRRILHDKSVAFDARDRMRRSKKCEICFDKPICDFILKELETRSHMMELIPQPYPTNKHRSEPEFRKTAKAQVQKLKLPAA